VCECMYDSDSRKPIIIVIEQGSYSVVLGPNIVSKIRLSRI
jgi:hypothetical protein